MTESAPTSEATPEAGSSDGPEISVVIPVYKSAGGIEKLHTRVSAALAELTGGSYEIVYVDDDSPDDSWETLKKVRGDDDHTVLLRLMQNGGQQRAVLCGLHHARGRYVVTMDDDLQQRPEEIRLLYDAIRETDADAVIGSYGRKKHGLVRGVGTRAVHLAIRYTIGAPKGLELTSFRILTREVARRLTLQRNPSPVVGFLLLQVTKNIRNVPVHHDPRELGTSTYSLSGLVKYFAQMVLDYSDLPLRVVGYVGFLVALASFGLGSFYLVRYFAGLVTLPGWVTLVFLLCFFAGLILMSLGIIGVYLMRLLRSVNTTTTYDVRESIR